MRFSLVRGKTVLPLKGNIPTKGLLYWFIYYFAVSFQAWKARVAGYEEVVKTLQTVTDEKSPEFTKYAAMQRKFVTDSNAIAQEKALDAVLAYAENAGQNIMGR